MQLVRGMQTVNVTARTLGCVIRIYVLSNIFFYNRSALLFPIPEITTSSPNWMLVIVVKLQASNFKLQAYSQPLLEKYLDNTLIFDSTISILFIFNY
jgi:hypothetical protein